MLNENRRYIVAKSEKNEICGFAGILINYDMGEIMNIVVKKDKRQQGIGQELLNALIILAEKTGLESLILEVNEKNRSAIRLYEKNGFQEVGERKKYYHNVDNAILMQKKLYLRK